MVYKILKTRILVAVLFFLSVWITYQYMESKFLQPYHHKEKPIQLGDGRKVTVTVYYECLCPDSKSFILNHLLPSFEKAHHLLKLELIPYGKAETHSTSRGYEFECQHGPAECLGNKVHSCVISHVPDEMLQLRMVSCLMEDHSDVDTGPTCARKLGVDWAGISTCVKTEEGSNLLKIHGDSTNALSPQISFVPTILLNYKRDGQPAILKNLWKEICRYFDKLVTKVDMRVFEDFNCVHLSGLTTWEEYLPKTDPRAKECSRVPLSLVHIEGRKQDWTGTGKPMHCNIMPELTAMMRLHELNCFIYVRETKTADELNAIMMVHVPLD